MSRHLREQTLLSPMSGATLVVLDDRTRTCPACERPFISRLGHRITCSDACRKAYIADWPHEIDDEREARMRREPGPVVDGSGASSPDNDDCDESAANRAGGPVREQARRRRSGARRPPPAVVAGVKRCWRCLDPAGRHTERGRPICDDCTAAVRRAGGEVR